MWKTERKRWDPSSSIPGTNDVGKRRKLCIFSLRDLIFKPLMLLWVAWGSRISQYALVLGEVLPACLTDLSASVEGTEEVSLHTWLVGCSWGKGRCSAVSQYVNQLLLLQVLFWKLISQVLWLWGNTPQTSNNWSGSGSSCETLHQKMSSWLALFQWINHQIEV